MTGAALVYLNCVRDLFNVSSKVATFPTIPWRQSSRAEPAPFAMAIDTLRRAYPDRAITEIRIPQTRTAGYLFFLRRPGDVHRLGGAIAWVHPRTGEMLVGTGLCVWLRKRRGERIGKRRRRVRLQTKTAGVPPVQPAWRT